MKRRSSRSSRDSFDSSDEIANAKSFVHKSSKNNSYDSDSEQISLYDRINGNSPFIIPESEQSQRNILSKIELSPDTIAKSPSANSSMRMNTLMKYPMENESSFPINIKFQEDEVEKEDSYEETLLNEVLINATIFTDDEGNQKDGNKTISQQKDTEQFNISIKNDPVKKARGIGSFQNTLKNFNEDLKTDTEKLKDLDLIDKKVKTTWT